MEKKTERKLPKLVDVLFTICKNKRYGHCKKTWNDLMRIKMSNPESLIGFEGDHEIEMGIKFLPDDSKERAYLFIRLFREYHQGFEYLKDTQFGNLGSLCAKIQMKKPEYKNTIDHHLKKIISTNNVSDSVSSITTLIKHAGRCNINVNWVDLYFFMTKDITGEDRRSICKFFFDEKNRSKKEKENE